MLFGEALLRFSTPNSLRFGQTSQMDLVYGGSELNVASSLAQLGIQTEFVSRLPQNDLGNAFIAYMRQNGVGASHMQTGGDRVGLYFIELGAGHRGGKVVYDRANSSMATIEERSIDWAKVFADADWFHWSGITPGISASAAAVCLEAIETAQQLGLTISTDFNYRANLWNYGELAGEVMEPMIQLCDIAVVGDYACEQYFGIKPSAGIDKNTSLVEQLKARFPKLKIVAITNRETVSASHNKWSTELFSDTEKLQSKVYDITHIVDRIGAGDAFVAGLIYGLRSFSNEQEALEFATAAACLKHTIFGDANRVSVEEVEELVKAESVGLVKR